MDRADYERFIQSAIEAQQVFLWQWEVEEDRLSFSPGTEAFFLGEEPGAISSVNRLLEEFVDEPYGKVMRAKIVEAKERGVFSPYELKLSRKDGTVIWVTVSGKVICDASGKATRMVGTFQDIGAMKERYDHCIGQQNFLASLIELIPYPVFYKNRVGLYEFCNEKFCEYLRMDKEDIIGSSVFDVAPRELAEVYYHADQKLMREGGFQRYESQLLQKDGDRKDVRFEKTVYRDESGELIGLMGIVRDITEEVTQRNLAQKREEIRELFLEISQMISHGVEEVHLFDALVEGLVAIFENAHYGSILEIVNQETLSSLASSGYREKGIAFFEIPLKESFVYRLTNGDLFKPRIFRDLDFERMGFPRSPETLDGGKVRSVLSIPVMLDDYKELVVCLDSKEGSGFTEAALDIADFVSVQLPILYQIFKLNRKTVELSRYDNLTGLVNRGYFQMLLKDRLALAKRNEESFLLVMMDLDGLKAINDSYGHHAGDMYIRAFGAHIRDYFRSTDIISRIGGDEFAGVFMTNHPERLFEKLDEFHHLFKTMPIDVDGQRFHGSYSYGVARYPEDGVSPDALLRIADHRMYDHKKTDRL